MEHLTLKNGKIIDYDYRLEVNGANFYIYTKTTKEEQKEIRSFLQSERDVLHISF